MSAGAACRSGVPKPSATLLAMGVTHDLALGGIRLSLGRSTTREQIDAAVDRLKDAVRAVRAVQGG